MNATAALPSSTVRAGSSMGSGLASVGVGETVGVAVMTAPAATSLPALSVPQAVRARAHSAAASAPPTRMVFTMVERSEVMPGVCTRPSGPHLSTATQPPRTRAQTTRTPARQTSVTSGTPGR